MKLWTTLNKLFEMTDFIFLSLYILIVILLCKLYSFRKKKKILSTHSSKYAFPQITLNIFIKFEISKYLAFYHFVIMFVWLNICI